MPISSDRPDTAPGEQPAIATACGKLILLGEHSVVYGEPAIAVPLLPLRLSVVLSDPTADRWKAVAEASGADDPAPLGPLTEAATQPLTGDADATQTMLPAVGSTLDREPNPPLTIDLEPDAPEEAHAAVSRALGAAARSLGLPVPLPLRIAVRSGGLRSGMGTSAALGVAMARALLGWHNRDLDERVVLAAAEAVERLFHGNPSGIDHTVSALERPLWYVKGQAPEPLMALPPLTLVLLPRQSERATMEIVGGVRDRLVDNPSMIRTVAEMGRFARLGREAWTDGDLTGLARALTAHQESLDRLGVVNDDDRVGISAALDVGALAAKITGAGWGGTLLALVDSEESGEAVRAAWGDGALLFGTG